MLKTSPPVILRLPCLTSEVGGLIRSEETVLSLLSGLAPPLRFPVGPVIERLPMPGTVTIEVPSGILPLGAMASEPLLPTQNLVLRGTSSSQSVVGAINAV